MPSNEMTKTIEPEIETIRLPLFYRLATVNCYLIKTGKGYILIDTGLFTARAALDRELARAGCKVGALALILLTHGDFDHTGNAAYLRRLHGAKIAMHSADAGMVERGDMFWNRKKRNWLIGMVASLLFASNKANLFEPDLHLEGGQSLLEYGLDAHVLSIPGHSAGSIGILTTRGDLFCGDFFANTARPILNDLMDDMQAAQASLARLQGLRIETVYPGHGKPFAMDTLSVGR